MAAIPTGATVRQPAPEQFLKDVAKHRMTVMHSADPCYRHLRFKKPGDSNMWFDLVTWPGFLTISGDMGCWTFARVSDMFNFFRSSELRINASYWAQKLQNGTHGGSDIAKVWDDDLFRTALLGRIEGHDLTDDQNIFLKKKVQDEVFNESGEHFLQHAAYEFTRCLNSECINADYCLNREKHREDHFQFDSSELPSGKDYAYHFIWCLHAIVWGIQQWDAAQVASVSSAPECEVAKQ